MARLKNPSAGRLNSTLLEKLRSFPRTDAGNAEAFELLHGSRFRYDHSKRRWLVWNGRYWALDEDGKAMQAALRTARARRRAAITIQDTEKAKQAVEWAFASESAFRRKTMLESAQSIPSLATKSRDFDRDPFLLTVGNGTLDLRTGKLRAARPEDLITLATDVPYSPHAKCPRFMKFVEEVFAGAAKLIRFIQRAVGYSLTGNTREQCFFICWGEGSNGKTTLIEILLKLLGAHATPSPFSTFLIKRNPDAPRDDLAALCGARLVTASEPGQQATFDEATIKQLTGGNTIRSRHLYGRFFTYTPSFKIWLETNAKPTIRETGEAMRRRVKLVPFTQTFKGKSRDRDLLKKLERELPGILAWVVRGCLEWQRCGLGQAPSVDEATEQYLRESDSIGRFLGDQCLRGSGYQVPGKEFYEAYASMCRQQGEKPVSNNALAQALKDRGIKKARRRKGVVYLGVKPLGPSKMRFLTSRKTGV